MLNDFTFVITGKYDDTHLLMIHELKKYGRVILSTYKSNIRSINDSLYDLVILSSDDEMMPRGDNPWYLGNAYQSLLVYQSVMLSTTKYTIRCRTDMSISNISYLIDVIQNTTSDKLCVSNVSWAINKPYHLGDHLIGGTTKLMQRVYTEMYNACVTGQFMYDGLDRYHSHEVNIFASLLKTKNKKVIEPEFLDNIWKWIWYHNYGTFSFPIHSATYNKLLIENFELIDYQYLEPFYMDGKATSIDERRSNSLLPCYPKIENYGIENLSIPVGKNDDI